MEFLQLALPAILLLLVLVGLALRLPAAMVLAGGAILGALAGQGLGIYEIFLMGDLASEVQTILGNENLMAIPLLVLSGTLLGDSAALTALRSRLPGPFAALGDTLLAMAGGGGQAGGERSAVLAALERAAPASAFLVLVAALINQAYLAADIPGGFLGEVSDRTVYLMTAMLIPAMCLAAARALQLWSDPEPAKGKAGNLWLALAGALSCLTVPVLILAEMATPVEAGASGVALALMMKAMSKELHVEMLGNSLDRALPRAAGPFAAMIAAAGFMLVFQAVGGRDLTESLMSILRDAHGASAAIPAAVLLAFLGLLIEPMPLVILFMPLIGPFLLEQQVPPAVLGGIFVLAPLSGLLRERKRHAAFLALCQVVALSVLMLWPHEEGVEAPADEDGPLMPVEKPEEGFTPTDTSDSPNQNGDEKLNYAPPNDNE